MNGILICDDDRDIVSALKIYLKSENNKLYEAYNGREALGIIQREQIDVVLLDVMMPEMDGITATSKIREISNVPILLLTAKSEDTDKILGLNIGADDYITKPFNPLEVTARVNSQLRRYKSLGGHRDEPDTYVLGGLEVSDAKKTVTMDGEPVSLTPKEYDILLFLMKSPDRVFSPKEIYREVWKETPLSGNDNTVAVHIRHLREKIEIDPNNPRYIQVIFGKGYKISERKTEK